MYAEVAAAGSRADLLCRLVEPMEDELDVPVVGHGHRSEILAVGQPPDEAVRIAAEPAETSADRLGRGQKTSRHMVMKNLAPARP